MRAVQLDAAAAAAAVCAHAVLAAAGCTVHPCPHAPTLNLSFTSPLTPSTPDLPLNALQPCSKDDANAHLLDKDIWDEVWAYEPRFGTVENPIQVPALLSERIIGVTDPEDDTLVIWGIIREGEPPKQLVAGGEFFVLQRVERVEKVGDRLNISLEAPRVVES
jgi:hypothetical protein